MLPAIRHYTCISCKNVIQVTGDAGELDGLLGQDESVRCVTPLCSGRLIRSKHLTVLEGFKTQSIPVKLFFRGVYGFGVGSGNPAAVTKVYSLLTTKRVVDMDITPVGEPERVIIKTLTLEDGTRLHFDSSTRGACIYYVEEPEVASEQLHSSSVVDVHGEDREEARRDAETDDCLEPQGEPGSPASSAPVEPQSGGVPSVPEAGDVPAGTVIDRKL